MIIVDSAIKEYAKTHGPIRVGVIGAGFMARGIIRQLVQYSHGISLVAVANRTPERAKERLLEAGVTDIRHAETHKDLSDAFTAGAVSITSQAELLTTSPDIDVIMEVTGALEYGAQIVTSAIKHKKHVISMNAELDATVGAILARMAREAGVVYSLCDGDQPGVQMNLYRYVCGLGLTPVMCGNIKGLHDPYRTPKTQEAFAKKWGQNPSMVTSFADGSKISFEQACVANATGMSILQRGMAGPTLPPQTPIEQVSEYFDVDIIKKGTGVVDYVVGAEPNGGIFVLATTEDPVQKHYLDLYKVGKGPLYCFYTPYHLCHFDAPSSIARAVIFSDPTLVSRAIQTVCVITAAKRDIKKGETLDPIGHFMTYGLCETASITDQMRLLPLGIAEGCTIMRDIPKDSVISLDDVVRPIGRCIDQVWEQQKKETIHI